MGVVDGDHLLNMNLFFSEAKIQFTKYAAPLLYLSGMDVTVVEVSDVVTTYNTLALFTACKGLMTVLNIPLVRVTMRDRSAP